MDRDPLQPIAPETLKIIQPVAAPIWIGKGSEVLNGTCTLLKLGDRRFGVTCDHVLKDWGEKDLIVAGYRVPKSNVVDRRKELDLAILDLQELGTEIESRGLTRFHEPVQWPPSAVRENDMIAFCGLPGPWREDLVFYSFGHAHAKVSAVGPTHLMTSLRFAECNVFQDAGKPMEKLDGISGGPVFAFRDLYLELVGIVSEQQRQWDLLRVSRTNVISADGTLLRDPPPDPPVLGGP